MNDRSRSPNRQRSAPAARTGAGFTSPVDTRARPAQINVLEDNDFQTTTMAAVGGVMKSPPKEIEQYDLCIVFPMDPQVGDVYDDAFPIIDQINKVFGRKYVYQYNAEDKARRFVLIRSSASKLSFHAERHQLKLLLEAKAVRQAALNGE
jgi:hypothetical protein